MSTRLVRWWGWLGERRLLAGWVAAMVGLLLFGGGVTLGASRAEDTTFGQSPTAPPPVEEVALPAPFVVEAVILARRPAGYLARTRTGDLVLIRTDGRTRYRALGKPAEANAIRWESIVVVRGVPGARPGVVRARLVAVR